MAGKLVLTIPALDLDVAISKAFKKQYKVARKKRDSVLTLFNIPFLNSDDYWMSELSARLLEEEIKKHEKQVKEIRSSYHRFRNYVHVKILVIKRFWLKRIRFASRAIGNVWDYSLEMVATPPTMASVDEYIHRRGGALVGSLA